MTEALVLPRSARDVVDRVPVNKRHPGLQLDKLSSSGDQRRQHEVLAEVTKAFRDRDEDLLAGLQVRRNEMLAALGAVCHRLSTRGPLTLHLSRSGTMENAGIALHPVYGFTYLPGSGIKGLVRAWAETVWVPAQADTETAWRMIDRAFGWSSGSERGKEWRSAHSPENEAAGRLVFDDAWPSRYPELQVDIVNNHHTEYYRGRDDPGDWEDPVPVYFLCIGAGETFDFPVSCRGEVDDDLVALAGEWLRAALAVDGAGAKTAAGYGRFEAVPGEPEPIVPDGLARDSHELQLAAPAFLAGAGQEAADCDLRPATMRGLLRWWWRTMHTAHLDHKTLCRLETAIWGDTDHGSAVRLAVHPRPNGLHAPQQHPDKKDRRFRERHDLVEPPRRGKVTQGLYYASYGMAEGEEKRWFRPAGCRWQAMFTARTAHFRSDAGGPPTRIEPEAALQQARAALWLLARFGGAGSRSRKGFGSFNDIGIPGIGSIEDCKRVGNELRKACGLVGNAGRTAGLALEQAREFELTTPWKDPWFAIDRMGTALQGFAKSQVVDKERMALGLPRNIGRGRGDSRRLRAGQIERHASPALWSLTGTENGNLTIRLVAFTAPRLPDPPTSEKVMHALVEHVRERLDQDVQEYFRRGQRRPAPPRPGATPQQTRAVISPLRKGECVEAILLEERTRKGGWRARHEASGKEMPIQNTQDVPASCEPGEVVKLHVFANDAFRWPTDTPPEKVQPTNRSEPSGPRRGGRKSRGRK